MRGEWVAIDLETTGLDTAKDAIIEVAAVRFRDGQEIGAFSSLVNPRRGIPQVVTDITGISNETIATAPTIDTVLPQFIDFIGDVPVVAHNVGFDISVLRLQHNVLRENIAIDTLDLAAMLMPRAARVNLRSLALELGLTLENAHRAQDDARATGHLYWRLWQKLIALPRSIVVEISAAAERLQWMTTPVLQAAVGEAIEKPVPTLPAYKAAVQAADSAQSAPFVSADEVRRAFSAEGTLAAGFTAYETRPQQLDMALSVAETLSTGGILLAEAGTGVGKSLAYLMPAALWAQRSGRPVVISTHTIGLQDQLLHSDIPRLRAVLGRDVRAAVLKGRSNYLCLSQFERLRERGPRDQTEFVMLGRLLVWLYEGGNGDRADLPARGPQEMAVWRRLSADEGFGCNPATCGRMHRSGHCPYLSAYNAAEHAEIIIVNHALLATPAVENTVSFDTVIIDEAHNLEDAITSGATQWIDMNAALTPVKQLGNFKRGDLAEVYQLLQNIIGADDLMRVEKFIDLLSGGLTEYQAALKRTFDRLAELREELISRGGNDQFMGVRVVDGVLSRDEFIPTLEAGREVAEFAQIIGQAIDQIIKRTQAATAGRDDSSLRELLNSIYAQRIALRDNSALLAGLLSEQHGNWVYWLSGSDNQFPLAVNRAPLEVGATLESTLWRHRAVVLTSATLRTGGDAETFDHLRSRLHVPIAQEITLGSPFNYKRNVLLYVPQDAPPPANKDGHQRSIDQAIIQLAVALNGRVLALFTSHAQVRQTTRNITARLGMAGIQVLSQSEGGGRQVLIDQFQLADKAVLLGTRMFWEGVDIPGDSLSAVVIAKLPFPVPNEPVIAARSEVYADAFNEFSVPEAILLFRQGFGRLIRTASDRGVVAILDSRVLTARYGKAFIAALPEMDVVRGPLAQMGKAAADWLPELKP